MKSSLDIAGWRSNLAAAASRIRSSVRGDSPPEIPVIPLRSGDRVVVVGGGPAGSFFAITLLREARRAGLELQVRVLERRATLVGDTSPDQRAASPSCNYCAGGISPRLADALDELGLSLPDSVIEGKIRRIVVQSHWKNLEIKVPEGRQMLTVYRGSRPVNRDDRHQNLDSFLLASAAREGAELVCAEVLGLARAADGRPTARVRLADGTEAEETAEILVVASGVNPTPGMEMSRAPLIRDLARILPGFSPPPTRRTLIFELELAPDLARSLDGELTFILYGSRDLRIEMGSLMPKGPFATVVLIGADVDRAAEQGGIRELISTFLRLPQVARVLPRHQVRPTACCLCRPNMVVGCAASPCGDRVAVIGDMVTSRLYKDGLHSAYLTASALARAVVDTGVDRGSLIRSYWPHIRNLNADQRSGRAVYLSMALAFRNPVVSRMAYQAVLRERRTLPAGRRPLEGVLWRVASGDDGYGRILRAMAHPRSVLSFLGRGVLITARNRLAEWLLGLSWRGFGRYPTGVYREELQAKTAELDERSVGVREFQDFRRMYSIRLRAPKERIFTELGRLGDPERRWLKSRFLKVRRISGRANEAGSILRYDVWIRSLSFHLELERSCPGRSLAYRVRDGFARGGLLVLDIEERSPGDCLLSLLVAFDFRKGERGWRAGIWALYRHLFPTFLHDVLWIHALCRLKHVVEGQADPDRDQPPPPSPESACGGLKNGKALSN